MIFAIPPSATIAFAGTPARVQSPVPVAPGEHAREPLAVHRGFVSSISAALEDTRKAFSLLSKGTNKALDEALFTSGAAYGHGVEALKYNVSYTALGAARSAVRDLNIGILRINELRALPASEREEWRIASAAAPIENAVSGFTAALEAMHR